MKKLVKLVKVNNLEYNVNRDPAVYRRCANESFRIQALLNGEGAVKCTLTDTAGKVLNEQTVTAPNTYTHEVSFPTPGARIVTLKVEDQGEKFAADILLDVMEHAWHG